ncbi:MAG: hypothetical protein M4579_000343 [Chaenotheca gracillima]|nr:MAG: hypothetical protein M4579_000343 [Chaenotheca gracillima]
MPPKSKRRVSEYDEEDDDGFIVDDSKPSTAKRAKTQQSMASTNVPGDGARDDDGSEYWEISKSRRVTISEFKGKQMVNIREYYEKDGKHLPGKKGISLPVEQYTALIAVLPHIETVLKNKGVRDIPRPSYSGDSSNAIESGSDDENEGAEPSSKRTESRGSKTENGGRKNFEATSDEDEEV